MHLSLHTNNNQACQFVSRSSWNGQARPVSMNAVVGCATRQSVLKLSVSCTGKDTRTVNPLRKTRKPWPRQSLGRHRLPFHGCTLLAPRHSIMSVALTMCPRLHDAKAATQTKTANAASSELGPPSSYTTAEGFTNPPSWTVPGTDTCNNGNPHARLRYVAQSRLQRRSICPMQEG